MSNEPKQGETPNSMPGTGSGTSPGPDAAQGRPEGAERASSPSEGALRPDVSFDQLKQIVAHLQKEIDEGNAKAEEQKNENLRLLADMENLRKRADREKEDTAKYAVTRFAQDVVGVIDNFERAAAAVPEDAAEKDSVLKSFLEGVLLAERDFLAVLSRHGIKQIDAKGQPFNPHQHQAVMEREDASVPAGTVIEVFQAGYMIEDRCLRPAMVVVSRGGPGKASDPATGPDNISSQAQGAPQGSEAPPAGGAGSDKPPPSESGN